MIGGLGRIIGGALLVFTFFPTAAGLMGGALIGIGISALIGMWRTRDIWSLKSERFDIKGTLGQVVPLMLGFGASQFMFTADTMFTKSFYTGDEMRPYGEAGTLSRALLWLVAPLAVLKDARRARQSVVDL